MIRRLVLVTLVAVMLSVVLAATGCSEPKESAAPVKSKPPAESPAAGMRLAPGLYDIEDGKVQALGTLLWRDLEGGFWAVLDGTKAETDEGATLAVIANPEKFADTLDSLKGRQVVAVGTKLDGASIRMAGPEIEIESIEEVTDTPGAAE